jgi:hypothetical protein
MTAQHAQLDGEVMVLVEHEPSSVVVSDAPEIQGELRGRALGPANVDPGHAKLEQGSDALDLAGDWLGRGEDDELQGRARVSHLGSPG